MLKSNHVKQYFSNRSEWTIKKSNEWLFTFSLIDSDYNYLKCLLTISRAGLTILRAGPVSQCLMLIFNEDNLVHNWNLETENKQNQFFFSKVWNVSLNIQCDSTRFNFVQITDCQLNDLEEKQQKCMTTYTGS